MEQDCFCQLFLNSHTWVQRVHQAGHRLLKDHGNFTSSDLSHAFFIFFEKILAIKQDLTVGNLTVTCQKFHNGKGSYGFTASGLSYQTKNLTWLNGETYIINCCHPCFISFKLRTEVFYF